MYAYQGHFIGTVLTRTGLCAEGTDADADEASDPAQDTSGRTASVRIEIVARNRSAQALGGNMCRGVMPPEQRGSVAYDADICVLSRWQLSCRVMHLIFKYNRLARMSCAQDRGGSSYVGPCCRQICPQMSQSASLWTCCMRCGLRHAFQPASPCSAVRGGCCMHTARTAVCDLAFSVTAS